MIKIHMKLLYNKNDEKEMKALMGFVPAPIGKIMDFLLVANLPTELSMLKTNSFQNHNWLLNMPPKCFNFNVYKQANVNIAITVLPAISDSDVMFCSFSSFF